MLRMWFAFKHGWQQRRLLKAFVADPKKRFGALSEITPEFLDAANVAVLVLDFDGVLAPHDASYPLPEAQKWLKALSLVIGEQRIALLTNKPKPERLRYFAEHFPSIYIAHHVRKKPYPDGLLQIANYKGIEPHRIALLDDRLLTGMLATCLAYCQGYYFYRPYRNMWRNPVRESFFSLLRVFERAYLSL